MASVNEDNGTGNIRNAIRIDEGEIRNHLDGLGKTTPGSTTSGDRGDGGFDQDVRGTQVHADGQRIGIHRQDPSPLAER